MKVELQLDLLELDCPDYNNNNNGHDDDNPGDDDAALKEWLWNHHRDAILQSLTVTRRQRGEE
eukprot:CAMPEP_0168759498 /NCGR_PEP_ID=MMETSP0724-20121128/22256_1 /TAXON_ID=265536 /ORGANISM="Amphiprora sp., Strain CCMP467" /LENGTH=62 /DNA_ID=CAMNT_0008808427 /DNA_START=146 /DNA_END=331 /DNA_ORIENTATION=+